MGLLRRRRRDREQPVGYRVARPFLQRKLRTELRTNDALSAEQREAIELALDDDSVLEAAYQTASEEFPDPNGRDWQGFFAGLVEFLKTLLPILLELFKGFGVPV